MITWFTRRLFAIRYLLIAVGVALPGAVQADSYPSRPIRLVVPIAPAGMVPL